MRRMFRYMGLDGSGSWRDRVPWVVRVGTQPEGSCLTGLPTGGDCSRDSFLFSPFLWKGELNELVQHCIVVKENWAFSVCTLFPINVLRISSSYVYHIVMPILDTSELLNSSFVAVI